jgi:hypothetical protein
MIRAMARIQNKVNLPQHHHPVTRAVYIFLIKDKTCLSTACGDL